MDSNIEYKNKYLKYKKKYLDLKKNVNLKGGAITYYTISFDIGRLELTEPKLTEQIEDLRRIIDILIPIFEELKPIFEELKPIFEDELPEKNTIKRFTGLLDKYINLHELFVGFNSLSYGKLSETFTVLKGKLENIIQRNTVCLAFLNVLITNLSNIDKLEKNLEIIQMLIDNIQYIISEIKSISDRPYIEIINFQLKQLSIISDEPIKKVVTEMSAIEPELIKIVTSINKYNSEIEQNIPTLEELYKNLERRYMLTDILQKSKDVKLKNVELKSLDEMLVLESEYTYDMDRLRTSSDLTLDVFIQNIIALIVEMIPMLKIINVELYIYSSIYIDSYMKKITSIYSKYDSISISEYQKNTETELDDAITLIKETLKNIIQQNTSCIKILDKFYKNLTLNLSNISIKGNDITYLKEIEENIKSILDIIEETSKLNFSLKGSVPSLTDIVSSFKDMFTPDFEKLIESVDYLSQIEPNLAQIVTENDNYNKNIQLFEPKFKQLQINIASFVVKLKESDEVLIPANPDVHSDFFNIETSGDINEWYILEKNFRGHKNVKFYRYCSNIGEKPIGSLTDAFILKSELQHEQIQKIIKLLDAKFKFSYITQLLIYKKTTKEFKNYNLNYDTSTRKVSILDANNDFIRTIKWNECVLIVRNTIYYKISAGESKDFDISTTTQTSDFNIYDFHEDNDNKFKLNLLEYDQIFDEAVDKFT